MASALIFPGSASQGTPSAIWREGPTDTLLNLKAADGTRVVAVFGKGSPQDADPPQKTRVILIYFYGNGMCMTQSRPVFTKFRRLGYDVIMPDYEGYGMSAGKPSEQGCYAAADAVYDYLVARSLATGNQYRIVATGWSLGSAVAIDLANRKQLAGVVAISPFTNAAAVAQQLADGMPVGFLVGSQFDCLSKIPTLSCPILLINGLRDTLATPQMSDALAAAAKTKCLRYRVGNAGHNDIFTTGGETMFLQIKRFVTGL